MSSSKMTLTGLYKWDETLFDDVVLPDGLNKETLVDEILVKAAEFEIVYPDPTFLKSMITHWAKKNYRTFEKWVEALALEFNPLYNFDRYEEYTDSRAKEDSRNMSQNAASNSATNTTTKDDTTLSRNVSAFDSSTYQPKEQEITDSDITVSGVENATSANATNEKGRENELSHHNAHLFGNIGVTTSTQLLEDFLRVERFNIYEQIADMFLTEFCVLVYE